VTTNGKNGRVCARAGCNRQLNKHAHRANFCSPACAQAARVEIERPAAGRPRVSDSAPRGVHDASGDRLGDISERIVHGGQREFVARDKQLRPLGVFDSWSAAATEIVKRAWNVR
jgi:hypothetical protein